ERSNQLTHPDYMWVKNPEPIEPGEKTSIGLGTSADNLFIIQQVEKRTGSQQTPVRNYSFARLNNEKRSFEFSATEADRGGYGVSYVFVKHNRFFETTQTIIVPWSNKDLKIEYATFRDKTLPGSEERWKVKLSGPKNEKVAAEMLASMYDASLDQFYPHSWDKPAIWPSYYSASRWNANLNFSMVVSNQKNPDVTEYKDLRKEYDELDGTGKGRR